MSNDKIYCGSGKRVGNYGTIAVSVCLDDIPAEYKQKSKNGKTYVNIRVDEKREVDQYGKSHSVTVDTWKPDAPKSAPSRPAPARPQFEDLDDELGF